MKESNCVLTKQDINMENNIDKAAILIAESVATMVDVLGMKSFNDARIQQGFTPAYDDSNFSYIANELRHKIETFKIETEIK